MFASGSGPYPVSLRSKRFTVYQKSQRKVLLSNNDSVETHAFGWRVMKGKSHLNYSQLGSLRKSHLVSKKANGVRILAINLTPELDGLRVRFQFDATKENTNLTKLESSWVELRVSSELIIHQLTFHTTYGWLCLSLVCLLSGMSLLSAKAVSISVITSKI